jgi:peptide subunit release factor 1 (eRF1)
MVVQKQYILRRREALKWLDQPGSLSPVASIYLKAGSQSAEIERSLLSVMDRGELFDEISAKADGSPAGSVIFCGMERTLLLRPPFPLQVDSVEKGYSPAPIKSLLEREWCVGLVLVRLGHFAIAVFQGEKLLEYKAGTGLVHARHHKGGSSANRFARHREKQMEYFFSRVEGHARDLLESRLHSLDYIIYGGTRETLRALWKQCPFFRKLELKAVPRLLDVREPKFSALAGAIEQAYTTSVHEF